MKRRGFLGICLALITAPFIKKKETGLAPMSEWDKVQTWSHSAQVRPPRPLPVHIPKSRACSQMFETKDIKWMEISWGEEWINGPVVAKEVPEMTKLCNHGT